MLVLAPFATAALLTIIARVAVPWGLEWNEGHGWEQAQRFARGQPLYPPPDEGWIPYMYAPLYHWIWGGLIRLTAWQSLVLGRLISLAGLAGALSALAYGSIRRTGRLEAGLFSAFLFLAFFGPSGCWYDLARIDMLAVGLMLWGVVLLPDEENGAWRSALPWVLLGLASLTKQSLAPITLAGWIWILWKDRRTGSLLAIGTLLTAAGLLHLHAQTGSSWFWFWVVEAPRRHATDWASVFWPVAEGQRPRAWTDAIAPTLVPLLLVGVRFLGLRGRDPNGRDGMLMGMMVLALTAGLVGLAKFGGFRNNLIPFFGLLALLSGTAFGGMLTGRAGSRFFGPLVLTGLLILQAWQPWGGQRWHWDPWRQVPEARARLTWDALQTWLKEHHREGESVWVVHHRWMGERVGHPSGYNADMVRVAEWAGVRVPWGALEPVARRDYDWIVLDKELAEEWLPSGTAEFMSEHYRLVGSLESVLGVSPLPLRPVTGAVMSPSLVWVRVQEVGVAGPSGGPERPVDNPEPPDRN
jgi:hypothetical protein